MCYISSIAAFSPKQIHNSNNLFWRWIVELLDFFFFIHFLMICLLYSPSLCSKSLLGYPSEWIESFLISLGCAESSSRCISIHASTFHHLASQRLRILSTYWLNVWYRATVFSCQPSFRNTKQERGGWMQLNVPCLISRHTRCLTLSVSSSPCWLHR